MMFILMKLIDFLMMTFKRKRKIQRCASMFFVDACPCLACCSVGILPWIAHVGCANLCLFLVICFLVYIFLLFIKECRCCRVITGVEASSCIVPKLTEDATMGSNVQPTEVVPHLEVISPDGQASVEKWASWHETLIKLKHSIANEARAKFS